jgi:hypothetical protein
MSFKEIEKELNKYEIDYEGNTNELILHDVKYDYETDSNYLPIISDNKKIILKSLGTISSSKGKIDNKVRKFFTTGIEVYIDKNNNTLKMINKKMGESMKNKEIIKLIENNQFVEAKNLFEEVLLEKVSERILEKKEEIINDLKLGLKEQNYQFPHMKFGSQTKESMIKVVVDYLKRSDEPWDDSDSTQNIEYYLKNPNEASDVRKTLEKEHKIVHVYSDPDKGEYYLGFKSKNYSMDEKGKMND